VRAAYADAAVPLKEIAARFGMTPQRIVAKATKDGWTGRERAAKARGRSDARPPRKPQANDASKGKNRVPLPTRGAQRALIGRLYRAISLKLEHMEKRMASGEARSAQDEERESRALATLINNFEKVTEAGAELDKDRDASRASGRGGPDAERMRREIAERLERLGGVGSAERRSGKPRS
jgi:hypothetical protein